MISTVLANLGGWSDLLLAAAAAGVLVCGVLLARRGARGRRAAGVLALLALAGVLALTLAPESGPDVPHAFCWASVDGTWFHDTANLALLLPVALFAVVATRRPLPVLAAAAGLSALIELVQGAATALNRSCDVNDWITNTAGATAGALLGWSVLLVADRIGGRGRAVAQPADRDRVASR